MPKALKIVVGIIALRLIVSIFALPSPSAILRIAVWLGILAGFRTRSCIAWHFARVVILLGVVLGITMVVVASTALIPELQKVDTGLFAIMSMFVIVSIALSAFQFVALGTVSVRQYFGIMKKHTGQQSP